MNILHICSLDNDKANGVSVIVPQYAKSQVKENNVYMINISNVICEPIDGALIFTKKDSIQEILEKYNIEIAVFHGIYFKEYISYYKKIKGYNIPYVVIPHGSLRNEAQSQKRLPKIILNKLFFNSFINNSSITQYLSEAEKNASSKFKHQNVIIPNGIFIKENLEWQKKKKEHFDFIFIGRYAIFHKGLDILINACEEIKDFMRNNKIRVNLYGVDFENSLERLNTMVGDKGISDIVKLNDGIYGDEKFNKLLEADCFIQTSRSEGQPVGIIEALSVGLVSVVTDGTTFADLVEKEECGYAAGSTSHSVAETMIKVYKERGNLPQMSKRAREVIKDSFSWDMIAKKTKEIYSEMIDR